MATREVMPSDDFPFICSLVEHTVQRFHREIGLDTHYSENPKFLKQVLFPDSGKQALAKAFVTELNGQIHAFACVNLSGKFKNGYVVAGVEEGHESELAGLVNLCGNAVRDNGGSKLHKFVALVPGQIRNSAITFWERFGFISNPYFHAHIQLDVDAWMEPADLDTDGIMPADDLELNDILQILMEDREEELAAVFQSCFPTKTPDHVILIMRSGTEINGISYFRVANYQDQQSVNRLGAWNVGFHFRPGFSVPRSEKRRFIQAIIASMKQLKVAAA